jgi:hypothetical protein
VGQMAAFLNFEIPQGSVFAGVVVEKVGEVAHSVLFPSNPVEDEAIQRKPTRPIKVMTGAVRQDQSVEFVPRSVAPAIPKVESLTPDKDSLVKAVEFPRCI